MNLRFNIKGMHYIIYYTSTHADISQESIYLRVDISSPYPSYRRTVNHAHYCPNLSIHFRTLQSLGFFRKK
jgi:predicted RNA methylase